MAAVLAGKRIIGRAAACLLVLALLLDGGLGASAALADSVPYGLGAICTSGGASGGSGPENGSSDRHDAGGCVFVCCMGSSLLQAPEPVFQPVSPPVAAAYTRAVAGEAGLPWLPQPRHRPRAPPFLI